MTRLAFHPDDPKSSMPRSSEPHAAIESSTRPSPEELYAAFHARTDAAFAQYPELEPLRRFVFRGLLLQRRAEGVKDRVKHWLRPLVRRAHTRLPQRHADVLIWLESEREVVVDALLPVYRELVARGVGVELVADEAPHLPVPARTFKFPARALAPAWASPAWEALCECEDGLRERSLRQSFHHACAMLQGLYDELHRLLEATATKIVLCASNQGVGGAALMVVSRLQGVTSLLLQHGLLGPNYIPVLADLMLIWGPSSERTMLSLGVPRAVLLTVGSPRHDSIKPAGTGHARATLLQALGLAARPSFVFFSQGHNPVYVDAAVECAAWLDRTAARYANVANVVVRLHPNEDGRLYRRCSHLKVIRREVELSTVLEGCDRIGSMSSSVLYDGLLFGKLPWQLFADHWPLVADNWRHGLALRVSSECHLGEMVRAMLPRAPARGVDEELIAQVFANRGRAAKAVADVVVSRLRSAAGEG